VAIEVAPDVDAEIREYPGGISLQLVGASDPEAAVQALRRARRDIAELDGGWRSAPNLRPGARNGPTDVGAVVLLPTGPVISVDGGYTPLDLLATIPDLVVRRLAEAGVADARIVVPRTDDDFDWWGNFYAAPRAVVLHLWPEATGALGPRSRTKVPAAWLEAATAWLGERHHPDEELRGIVAPVALSLDWGQAGDFLDRSRSGGSARLVSGHPLRRMLVVDVNFIGFQHLVVAGGGPMAGDSELLEIFESLLPLARALAPELGHARLSIEPDFYRMRTTVMDDQRLSGWCPGELIGDLADEITYDAAPYQILGPGHLRRLEEAGRRPDLRPLEGGRAELSIGAPTSWLPDDPDRASIQASARELLRPCLATADEARAIGIGKRRRGSRLAGEVALSDGHLTGPTAATTTTGGAGSTNCPGR
jgi:hypothetical protein